MCLKNHRLKYLAGIRFAFSEINNSSAFKVASGSFSYVCDGQSQFNINENNICPGSFGIKHPLDYHP